jgi:hypothetical protein
MKGSATTSVVIIDTESYDLALVALHNTLQRMAADDVVIFSDDPSRWGAYSVAPISKITSMADYNRIVIERLPEALKTDFALLIQFDGFAIDASSFSEAFYDVDYIGAPWPAALFPERGRTVGNGGFSLRSKRLIESVARQASGLDFSVAEDITICVNLRDRLESDYGIEFASVELANAFSTEWAIPDGVKPFGFHGLHLLPKIYRSNYQFLIDHLPNRCLSEGSQQLQQLRFGFATLGPEANAALEARVQQANSASD